MVANFTKVDPAYYIMVNHTLGEISAMRNLFNWGSGENDDELYFQLDTGVNKRFSGNGSFIF